MKQHDGLHVYFCQVIAKRRYFKCCGAGWVGVGVGRGGLQVLSASISVSTLASLRAERCETGRARSPSGMHLQGGNVEKFLVGVWKIYHKWLR